MRQSMLMRLNVHACDGDQARGDLNAYYAKPLVLQPGREIPREGDYLDVFGDVCGPRGVPVAIVDSICWRDDLAYADLLIVCGVDVDFFLDRPWRQRLEARGWRAWSDEATIMEWAASE